MGVKSRQPVQRCKDVQQHAFPIDWTHQRHEGPSRPRRTLWINRPSLENWVASNCLTTKGHASTVKMQELTPGGTCTIICGGYCFILCPNSRLSTMWDIIGSYQRLPAFYIFLRYKHTHIHRSRIHYTKNNQSMWCEIEFQTQLCRNKVCSAPNTPNYKVLQSLYVFHLALLHVILLPCRGNRSSLFCSPELCRLPMPNSLAIPGLKLVTSGAIASETGRFVIRPFMTIIKFMTLMTLYV